MVAWKQQDADELRLGGTPYSVQLQDSVHQECLPLKFCATRFVCLPSSPMNFFIFALLSSYVFAEVTLAVTCLELILLAVVLREYSCNTSVAYKHHTDQTSDATTFRQALNLIHSGAINTFIDSLPANGFLGVQSPPIAEKELELPREIRVQAQQAKVVKSRLNSYLFIIDPDILNLHISCMQRAPT